MPVTTQSGRLYHWGRCSRDSESVIEKPQPVAALFDVPIKSVSSGSHFSVALAEDGRVFTLGSHSWFIPSSYEDENLDEFAVRLWSQLSSTNIVQVTCGNQFVLVLDESGNVYSWGTGAFGQLGHEESKVKCHEEYKIPEPYLIETLSGIVHIACGDESAAAVDKDGRVFTWGRGLNGALGHGSEDDLFVPKQVTAIEEENIVSVSCGSSHMAAINHLGELFTWGNNYLGPLGRILGRSKDKDLSPQLVELVQIGPVVSEENLKGSDEFEFVQVECLRYNTVALTNQGQLYSCGKGGSDGGGHGDQPHTLLCLIELETKVSKLANARYVHVGTISGQEEEHTILVWGSAEDGRLGLGDTTPQLYPKLLMKDRSCVQLSCGESHTCAIFEPRATDANPDPSAKIIDDLVDEDDFIDQVDLVKPVESAYDGYEQVQEDSSQVIVAAAPISEPVTRKDSQPKIIQSNQSEERKSKRSVILQTVDNDAEAKFLQGVDPSSGAASSTSHSPPAKANSPPARQDSKNIARVGSQNTLKDVSGYLNKKGDKGIVKLWRKRYFKMSETIVEYFEKEDTNKKGIIKLSDILDVLPGHMKFGFNLISRTGRVYELQAFDNESFIMWSQGLKARLRPV
ncbi:E3 ubiquitin-protein ligase HERC [Acrasis kona]|uniref:E3 ubiquitin-protein ligase HERC n=1 Tax=Acrasis kona TaxID=1008807 RepID=A0AAW2YSI6_9EUKA